MADTSKLDTFHESHKLEKWLRKNYPSVLREFTQGENAKWERKLAALNPGPASRTRVTYITPQGEPYKVLYHPDTIQKPEPSPEPHSEDFSDAIALAREMGLGKDYINRLKEIKKKADEL